MKPTGRKILGLWNARGSRGRSGRWSGWAGVALAGLLPCLAEAQTAPAPAPAPPGGLQGRVLWMDAHANLARLSTRAGVAQAFARCRQANINTVIVDVKPVSGHVLYASRVAPRLTN